MFVYIDKHYHTYNDICSVINNLIDNNPLIQQFLLSLTIKNVSHLKYLHVFLNFSN